MNPSSSTTPLTEVLPWSLQSPRTVLVCDSVESDGRFILHTVAAQVLASAVSANNNKYRSTSTSGRILWLTAGAWTERLLANALKKMGCEAANAYIRSIESATTDSQGSYSLDNSNSALTIRSLSKEIASRIEAEAQAQDEREETPTDWDVEEYIKHLYREVKEWSSRSTVDAATSWVILDDVSALAVLIGERLAYGFVLSLNALSMRPETHFGIILRCSHDADQELFQSSSITTSGEKKPVHRTPDSVGAGGQGTRRDVQNQQVPWERSLVEMADGIVDVMPLASGYTREAHGRLLFTACSGGRGWGDSPQGRKTVSNDTATLVVNYCLSDNKVLAIRVRGAA
jgi:hypothetical protein